MLLVNAAKGRFEFWLAVVTIAYLVAFLHCLPNLNGNWEWFHPYRPGPITHGMSFVFVACAAIGCVAWWGARRRGRGVVALGAVSVLAVVLQVAVVSMNEEGWYLLVDRAYKPGRTGYYQDARGIRDVRGFLGTYAERMPQFTMRSSTHPPGSVLFFWAVLRVTEGWRFPAGTAALYARGWPWLDISRVSRHVFTECSYTAFAVMLASTATLVSLYWLGRMRGDRRVALRACVLYSVMPVFAIRVPYIDHFYPAVTVLGFCAFCAALRRNRLRWAALAGVLLAVGVFMSFGLLAMIVFCATFALCERGGLRVRDLARLGGAFVCGLVIPFVLLRFCCGFDIVEVFQRAMENHRGIVWDRTYSLWLAYNPYEFFAWLGIPVAALFLRAAFGKRRHDALWIACAVTLVLLNFSGKSLGEVERLWLFMAPYVVLLAASELTARGREALFWIVFVLQCLSIAAFNSVISGAA